MYPHSYIEFNFNTVVAANRLRDHPSIVNNLIEDTAKSAYDKIKSDMHKEVRRFERNFD